MNQILTFIAKAINLLVHNKYHVGIGAVMMLCGIGIAGGQAEANGWLSEHKTTLEIVFAAASAAGTGLLGKPSRPPPKS